MKREIAIGLMLHVFASGVIERDVQFQVAKERGSDAEVRLWDGSRADLVGDQRATEIDWAHNWQQAVGQALYYAIVTGKDPEIILMTTGRDEDTTHALRCQAVCAKHGITLTVRRVN